jgi:peroxiredoxin Q/BCP
MIGKKAPAFSLKDQFGQKISLKDFLGKVVVLYFYPKDATPGCTQEACDFQDSLVQLKKSGAIVLGVSKDSVESHEKFAEKQGLSFSLLSDPEGQICEKYGVWKEKSLYGRKFMGIERTTFVIDRVGKIFEVFEKVKVKGHVAEVLETVKALK